MHHTQMDLNRVLIVTYFYPPSNFAGSHRVSALARHLAAQGCEVTVITRHWKDNETAFTPLSHKADTTNTVEHGVRVIRVAYLGTWRDRLHAILTKTPSFILRVVSLLQMAIMGLHIRLSPYMPMYRAAQHVVASWAGKGHLIVSGKPFYAFYLGHLLKKRHPHLHWYPDYRDPWNSESDVNRTATHRILSLIERPQERKWVRSASKIITVSQGVAEGIARVLPYKMEFAVVRNGFEHCVDHICEPKPTFRMDYIGTLYPSQRIEIFFEGLALFALHHGGVQVSLVFHGLGDQPDQVERLQKIGFIEGVRAVYLPKRPKDEVLFDAARADALLLVGIPQRPGTYSAKFFDYLSLRKPIVLISRKGDVLDEALKETASGTLCETPAEVAQLLGDLYTEWKRNGGFTSPLPLSDALHAYTNAAQAAVLIKHLSGSADSPLY